MTKNPTSFNRNNGRKHTSRSSKFTSKSADTSNESATGALTYDSIVDCSLDNQSHPKSDSVNKTDSLNRHSKKTTNSENDKFTNRINSNDDRSPEIEPSGDLGADVLQNNESKRPDQSNSENLDSQNTKGSRRAISRRSERKTKKRSSRPYSEKELNQDAFQKENLATDAVEKSQISLNDIEKQISSNDLESKTRDEITDIKNKQNSSNRRIPESKNSETDHCVTNVQNITNQESSMSTFDRNSDHYRHLKDSRRPSRVDNDSLDEKAGQLPKKSTKSTFTRESKSKESLAQRFAAFSLKNKSNSTKYMKKEEENEKTESPLVTEPKENLVQTVKPIKRKTIREYKSCDPFGRPIEETVQTFDSTTVYVPPNLRNNSTRSNLSQNSNFTTFKNSDRKFEKDSKHTRMNSVNTSEEQNGDGSGGFKGDWNPLFMYFRPSYFDFKSVEVFSKDPTILTDPDIPLNDEICTLEENSYKNLRGAHYISKTKEKDLCNIEIDLTKNNPSNLDNNCEKRIVEHSNENLRLRKKAKQLLLLKKTISCTKTDDLVGKKKTGSLDSEKTPMSENEKNPFPFPPLLSFSDLRAPTTMHVFLSKFSPTAVQSLAIPSILSHSDLLCRAPTGSGKTLAFLIPIVLLIENNFLCSRCSKIHAETNTLNTDHFNLSENDLGNLLKHKKFSQKSLGTSCLKCNTQLLQSKLTQFQYNPFNTSQNKTQYTSLGESIKVLVLTPTRELAFQIAEQLSQISKEKTTVLTGGHNIRNQQKSLSNTTYVIATPGRLCDFLKNGLRLNPKFVVYDEADRMLDMGFYKELSYIQKYVLKATKCMFSATFEDKVKEVAFQMLSKPFVVKVECESVADIKQEFVFVEDRFSKQQILLSTLKNILFSDESDQLCEKTTQTPSEQNFSSSYQRNENIPESENFAQNKHFGENLISNSQNVDNFPRGGKFAQNNNDPSRCEKFSQNKNSTTSDHLIIVFTETKATCKSTASFLIAHGINALSIHGDLEQVDRERNLTIFQQRRIQVLVATSVAARGLDIKGITTVINYDIPNCVKEYIHRIGRTGRSGNKGFALSFVDSSCKIADQLVPVLQESGNEVPDCLKNFQKFSFSRTRGSRNFKSTNDNDKAIFKKSESISAKTQSSYFSSTRIDSQGSFKKDSLNFSKKSESTNSRNPSKKDFGSSRLSEKGPESRFDASRNSQTAESIFSTGAPIPEVENNDSFDEDTSSE